MKPEVIVLGAGSAGLQAARNILERTNLDILVIEEHARIGYPEHCTGLISLNGVKNALRVPLQNLAVNYIHGAYIYSPSGIRLLVARTEPVAVVINRPLYEYMLYKLVADRVKFVLGVKASLANGKVYFRDTTLNPSFIVDARGLQSLTSRRPEARKHVIPALQFDMSARLEEYKYVHVFLGDQFSKGFFAWAVPLDDNRVRIGLASKGNVLLRLKTLANRLEKITNGIIKPTSRLRVLGGAVYTGGLADQVSGTVYYVGDSAGQTKPTTGGGL
ncbi:MAG: lycopene cyclase family protein, partial [Infirmifilum sp.]